MRKWMGRGSRRGLLRRSLRSRSPDFACFGLAVEPKLRDRIAKPRSGEPASTGDWRGAAPVRRAAGYEPARLVPRACLLLRVSFPRGIIPSAPDRAAMARHTL